MANPSLFKAFRNSTFGAKFTTFFILSLGLVIVGGSAGVIAFLIKNDPGSLKFKREIASEEVKELPRAVAAYSFSYQLRNISIPLATRDATRMAYAQFSLRFDLPSGEARSTMEMNRARVLNKVYEVASQFYVDDFKEKKGHTRFKVALRKGLAGELKAHAPRTLAIENWVLN